MFPQAGSPRAHSIIAEATKVAFQLYLAHVRFQRDTPVVAALCPISLPMEYPENYISKEYS